jgi:dCTP deaminase
MLKCERNLKGGCQVVLSRDEIRRRMQEYRVADRRSLVITPLLESADNKIFDDDSVDLRLGCYFLLPRALDKPFFSPDTQSATSLHVKVHVPLGEYLVVPAHQTILGATLEFIKLPIDVSGQVLTKSSVARTFIVVETAPWIHPQYRGCLTLEIANVSNTPVLLYPGRPICQLVLLQVANDKKDSKTRGKKRGKIRVEPSGPDPSYFGPVYPEAPKFKDPQDDLLKIGVTETSYIRQSRLKREGDEWYDTFCREQQQRK